MDFRVLEKTAAICAGVVSLELKPYLPEKMRQVSAALQQCGGYVKIKRFSGSSALRPA